MFKNEKFPDGKNMKKWKTTDELKNKMLSEKINGIRKIERANDGVILKLFLIYNSTLTILKFNLFLLSFK